MYSYSGGNYDGVSQYDTIETAPINNILYSNITVEFTFKCESTPANYSSHPVWWGEPGYVNEWIFVVYYFGSDSGSDSNRIQVYGSIGSSWTALSAISAVLTVGTTYTFKWVYNSVLGGQLYLDGLAVGGRVGSGSLDTKVGNIYIARNPKTYGGGRPHNFFDGDVTNIFISSDSFSTIIFPNGSRLSQFLLSGIVNGTLQIFNPALFLNGASFRPTVSDIKNLGHNTAWWNSAFVDGYYVGNTSNLISTVGGDLQINLPAGKSVKFVVGDTSASINDIYVALTGNDSNSGGTLASAKLTLYAGTQVLNNGGNFHIGFGDFSAQTSFQIAKSMTWVFDTSGGAGTTTFPSTV